VNIFPARRTRDLLSLVADRRRGGLVLLLRLVRARAAGAPEGFQNLVDFIAVLRRHPARSCPSEWGTRSS
jgi:ABC-2 type transport system permease protein